MNKISIPAKYKKKHPVVLAKFTLQFPSSSKRFKLAIGCPIDVWRLPKIVTGVR